MNIAEVVYGTFGSGGDWGLETGGMVESSRSNSTSSFFLPLLPVSLLTLHVTGLSAFLLQQKMRALFSGDGKKRASGLGMSRAPCWKTGGFAGEHYLLEVGQVPRAGGRRVSLGYRQQGRTFRVQSVTKIIKLIISMLHTH